MSVGLNFWAKTNCNNKKYATRFVVACSMRLKVRWKAGRKARLEVRSSVDFGWYDGNISLVDNDDGRGEPEKLQVRVHFTGFKEADDEFWGLEILRSECEIRRRVRLLSHQLQDKECNKVVVGMNICAHYESPDGVECKYYDAVVTAVSKAAHRRHNRDEVCRCSFTVQWQEGPVKGTYATLKCPDISLIVARDVDNHPVVRALLDFARAYSAVTPVVSGHAKHEESAPGSQVPHHSALTLESELSPEELPNIGNVQYRDGFDAGSPKIEDVEEQEGLEMDKIEVEVNQERNESGERVETIVVQEREGFKEGKFEFHEVPKQITFSEEVIEMKDEQARRALTLENPEIEKSPEQDPFQSDEEENEKRDGEGEEFDEEKQEKEPEAGVMELGWDEELEVEMVINELGSDYRVCEDEFLDLPKDIVDHLKTFQLVQDCLGEESLELEKILRSISRS